MVAGDSVPSDGQAASHRMSAWAAWTRVTVASCEACVPLKEPLSHLARRSTCEEGNVNRIGVNKVWKDRLSHLARRSTCEEGV